jgi:hypothetical protein
VWRNSNKFGPRPPAETGAPTTGVGPRGARMQQHALQSPSKQGLHQHPLLRPSVPHAPGAASPSGRHHAPAPVARQPVSPGLRREAIRRLAQHDHSQGPALRSMDEQHQQQPQQGAAEPPRQAAYVEPPQTSRTAADEEENAHANNQVRARGLPGARPPPIGHETLRDAQCPQHGPHQQFGARGGRTHCWPAHAHRGTPGVGYHRSLKLPLCRTRSSSCC